jgi:hypothetical protein
LENLASIVTSLQSDPSPPLRSGHETSFAAAASVLTASPNKEEGEGQGDEAVPSLSTWHSSASSDPDRLIGRQLYAAGLGLLCGLALVATALLWLGGWFDASRGSKVPQPAPAIEKPARLAEDAAPRSPAAEPKLTLRDERPAVAPTAPSSLELLAQEAVRRIESGDVLGARALLASADNDLRGWVPFTLAQTFDPNMLAAWGTRDVVPDIEKAKHLYGRALSLGYAPARQRLDLLN